MDLNRDIRINGEQDFPLPERKVNPTAEDKEKLKKLLEKYGQTVDDND